MSSETAEKVVELLKQADVDFFSLYPCERVRQLYDLVTGRFRYVSLSREEEGVGISAGAALAGKKPAMLIQSSGVGNMINALCSLTSVYQLPLLILVSWRGIYKEKIPAQVPLGEKLPQVLTALNIKFDPIADQRDISRIGEAAKEAYKNNITHAILFNPVIWEREKPTSINKKTSNVSERSLTMPNSDNSKPLKPSLTRLEVLKVAASYLEGKIVVCNLGIPCKELYSVKHQISNFYMLGSLGLASSIGLGISLFTSKEVVVIDGDGSLLTNLGALSTIAVAEPKNLTILAVDNGVHGSTGNQPTATSRCVDLELIARGLGIQKTYKVAAREEVHSCLQSLNGGPNFVHILAKPGNADVPDLPLTPIVIKNNVMKAINQ